MTVKDRKTAEIAEYRERAHRELDALLERLQRLGVSLPSPQELIEFGAHAQAPRHPLAEAIGPVYETQGVRRLTGLARQQLADRRSRGTILALRTSDDVWLYPAFQFEDGAVRPWVRRLLDVFRSSADVEWWTVAAWLNTPKTELGSRVPVEAVNADERDQVLALAERAASRWAA